MLKSGNEREIKKFYVDSLLRILKEVKPKYWKEKDEYFQRIICQPGIFLKEDFLEKYYENFKFELDKAIRTFLVDDSPLANLEYFPKFCFKPKKKVFEEEEEIIDTSSKNKQKKSLNEENKESKVARVNSDYDENLNLFTNRKFELDISDRSTKEEFSDFEDEFTAKYNNLNNLNDSFSLAQAGNKVDPNDDIHIYETQEKKLTSCKWEICDGGGFNAAEYKPKFAKREVINKRIIRKFSKFVQDSLKDAETPKEIKNGPDYDFYIVFKNGDFIPPLNFISGSDGDTIKFKSINDSYLYFIFSKVFVVRNYQRFINENFKDIFDDMVNYYSIDKSELLPLENYIKNLATAFDLSLIGEKKRKKLNFYGENLNKPSLFSRKNVKSFLFRSERSRENNGENLLRKESTSSEEFY